MRLFIAINFSENVRTQLYGIIEDMSKYAVKGNFTLKDNLHLTLIFIGEATPDKKNIICSIMKAVEFKSFELMLSGLGCFGRSGGGIWWIGARDDGCIARVYEYLCTSLSQAGFDIDTREYKPHLTIGREVILDDKFDRDSFSACIPNINVLVDKISLMKSERLNGRLTYSEIFSVRSK